MDQQHRHGQLVSFEGISGCGKTYLLRALKPSLPRDTTIVSEVVDRGGQEMDREIIRLLAACGDRFFRGGKPRTETFLLLALKMHDYETRISGALDAGHLVIEDRSIDTIAIYQALLLAPGKSLEEQLDIAHGIYTLAARWRRPPDLTFLIEDDFDVALRRVEQRENQQLEDDEVALLRQAAQLYAAYAPSYPLRFVRLSRKELTRENLLQAIGRHLVGEEAAS